MRTYCVYILGSRSHRLYTGVTSNLTRRVAQHRLKLVSGFTARYNITRLLYYECSSCISAAIRREKQIKGWSRRKKLALIRQSNPYMQDLMVDGKIRDSSPPRGSE